LITKVDMEKKIKEFQKLTKTKSKNQKISRWESFSRRRQSLAEATAKKNSFMDDKKIRDQAYTHLKKAVDQLYEYGQFAFRHTPDRRKGYKSNYMYVQRQKTRGKNRFLRENKQLLPRRKILPD
jgi:predicted transcriptional regulator YheO